MERKNVKIGSVPYLNSLPLTHYLPSACIQAAPTLLTELLLNDHVDLALLPVYSILKHNKDILLTATFKLKKSNIPKTEQQNLIREFQKIRLDKTPRNPSAGSFFKNPSPKKPAGMLIENAGLKGKTIGQAQISTKHANFIINLGGATSADILALASLAQKQVKDKFNIDLEPEVQIITP